MMAIIKKKNSLANAIDKGKELLDAGNYVEAKYLFEKLYREEPDDKEVQNYLGIILFKLGLHKDAMELYKKLLEKTPNFPSLHLNLGIIYYKEGLIDLALGEFKATIDFDPANKKAQNYLGLIYVAKGSLDKALEMFTLTGSKKMIKEIQDKMLQNEAQKEAPKVEKEKKAKPEEAIINEEPFETQAISEVAASQPKEQGILSIKEISQELRRNVFNIPPDECFLDIYGNLLKLNVIDEIYTRLSLLESFSGSLNFKGAYQVVQKSPTSNLLGGAQDPIFNISGNGFLVLSINDENITPFTLNKEDFYVREKYILAFEKSVSYENSSKSFAEDFDITKLYGKGGVALITKSKPISQIVDEDNPLAIKLDYIIGWHGDLSTHIIKGKESLFKRREDSKWVTFKGKGCVFCLVKEQAIA